MRKIVSVLLIVLACCACNQQEIDRLTSENEAMQKQLNEKDSVVNDMFKTLNEIDSNFASIREAELNIGESIQVQGELSADAKQRINDNMLLIQERLRQNKETIARLQEKLRKSDMKLGDFMQTINMLKEELLKKEQENEELVRQLETMDMAIGRLNTEVANLNTEKKEMIRQDSAKTETINQQVKELNTAYYVFGNSDELKKKHILSKKNVLVGVGKAGKQKDGIGLQFFTKIDRREVSELSLYAKKVKILSVHPVDSYSITKKDNRFEKLIIKDPQAFWSVTKYLVIQID